MAQRYCSNCGSAINESAMFCGRCGTPVARQGSRRFLYLSGGLVWVILVAVIVIFFRDNLRQWVGADEPEAGAVVESDGEPTAGVAVVEANETEEAATATSLPTLPPTRVPTAIPTPLPTQTALPTRTPTVTLTPTLTPAPSVTPTLSAGPETTILGVSANGRPIEVVRFGTGPNVIVFIGGLHAGFAPASVGVAERAVRYFREQPQEIPENATVYVIINMNPDSSYSPGNLPGRLNGHGVDLNRNWDCEWSSDPQIEGRVVQGAGGSAPLSEPETQVLADFIMENDPVAVIFWEAQAWRGLVSPGGCGAPSRASYDLTVAYARAAGYRWEDYENLTGDVVPGDATNWLDAQGIPATAVLLPSLTEVAWESNRAGIGAVLTAYGG